MSPLPLENLLYDDTDMLPGSSQKIYGLFGLKHHIVEIIGDVTDKRQQGKIELLSQWMLDGWVLLQKLSYKYLKNIFTFWIF